MAEHRQIIYAPQPDSDDRWQGTVQREDGLHREKVWRGRHVESVIQQMDKTLGPLPETEYQVQG